MLRRALSALALCALVACSRSPLVDRGTYVADPSHPAASHDARIRYLVLHYTALDADRSMTVLTTDSVSSHYLVPRDPFLRGGESLAKPFVFQLVREDERSWHAGLSRWQRASDLNDSSIGIEIINRGPLDPERRTWDGFDEPQIETVIRLTQDIVRRYRIPPTRVVGHADIAPQRKEDPGPRFPWERLYRAGVGAWPDAATVVKHLGGREPRAAADVCLLQAKLSAYGYEVALTGVLDDKTRRVLQAFQMHFRPADYAGDADAETEALASALLEKYAPSALSTPPPACSPPPGECPPSAEGR